DAAQEYGGLFDPGDFYLGIQPNGWKEQAQVNDSWRPMSRETRIGLVATGACYYVNRSDAKAHEILMCIQQGKTIQDKGRMQHETDAYYIKSPAEFNEAFKDIPEALENTVKIAARCNVELDLGKTYLPQYKVPEGWD